MLTSTSSVVRGMWKFVNRQFADRNEKPGLTNRSVGPDQDEATPDRAAVSSVRSAVVPTATTRRPRSRASRTAAAVRDARERGRRVVAVGTTALRTLETAARSGVASSWSGPTDLFVKPGFSFRSANCLLTNFHMPRTTLLVLVSTFASRELIREAYAEAIRERYRFLSYGDAMLIL